MGAPRAKHEACLPAPHEAAFPAVGLLRGARRQDFPLAGVRRFRGRRRGVGGVGRAIREANEVREALARIERDGYTIVEDVFSTHEADALLADLARLERELAIAFATNDFEGRAHERVYNLLAHGALLRGDPGAPARAPGRRGRARLRAAWSRRSRRSRSIPGETRAADPRRRSAAPAPEAARADRLQHDVGAHRLHRGERRDAHHPRLAQVAITVPSTAREHASIPAEMRRGSVLVWHGSLWHGGGANRSDAVASASR